MIGLIIALFPKNECYLSSRSAAAYGLATDLAAAGPSIDADEPFKRAIWISFDALRSLGGLFVKVRPTATMMAAK
ncbi:hypothetical protein [Bradyrhizobium sp. 170]|uniref:hypothetical protein n=1 Tax=Bradyrhizobium sp. 170 TaxID=2782641 RepID=UPI001FFEDC53|nr:hypothetical protein [Bradyrhizobium sp. 170]UPK00400.1 hypothetical protein IVB05_21780 [Bradyrhizobium sp. 170]